MKISNLQLRLEPDYATAQRTWHLQISVNLSWLLFHNDSQIEFA